MGSSASSAKSSFDKKDKVSEVSLVDSARKNKFEAPQYENTDEIIWETFYHRNGETYVCMYQSGERYVLNISTKEKYDFPKKWYNEGLLVTEDSKFMEERMSRSNEENSSEDDKSGFINHPTKGRLQTYMTEEKQYVHSYFDENLGTWVRLPMSWELLSTTTKNLMKPIQETLPNWDDEYDILASLRSHNYNSDLCISTFFSWGDMSTWYNGSRKRRNSENLMEQLNSKFCSMEENLVKQRQMLNEEKSFKEEAEIKVCALQEALIDLKAQHQTLQVKCETLQKSRPKTAIDKKGSCKVNKAALVNLESSVEMLRRNQMQIAEDFDSVMKELSGRLSEVFSKASELKLYDLDLSSELSNMKTLYRKETLQRKLLYNQLQELKGNIRVFCRCREDNRVTNCLKFLSETEIIAPNSSKTFSFNKVFGTNSTQEEVFEEAKAIITSCVDGYNVCILAYGQTGSGKTYTMQGPEDDPGVNIRSLKELLRTCQSRQNLSYTLKVSMLEIYNETIHDLLSSNVSVVEIRAQGNKINLQGVNEIEVRSIEDINKIMRFGGKNRTVAATKMNSQSSRSHLVFKVTVTGEDKTTGNCSVGSLTLCDLAGSERVNKSEATGQRLVEAAAINKSLTSLGQVFNALKTAQLHIPYRNSKLTHILQPSLGGDAKACLFIMVSPDPNNSSETLSTLQFGSNAQQIELGQAKRTLMKTSPFNK